MSGREKRYKVLTDNGMNFVVDTWRRENHPEHFVGSYKRLKNAMLIAEILECDKDFDDWKVFNSEAVKTDFSNTNEP